VDTVHNRLGGCCSLTDFSDTLLAEARLCQSPDQPQHIHGQKGRARRSARAAGCNKTTSPPRIHLNWGAHAPGAGLERPCSNRRPRRLVLTCVTLNHLVSSFVSRQPITARCPRFSVSLSELPQRGCVPKPRVDPIPRGSTLGISQKRINHFRARQGEQSEYPSLYFCHQSGQIILEEHPGISDTVFAGSLLKRRNDIHISLIGSTNSVCNAKSPTQSGHDRPQKFNSIPVRCRSRIMSSIDQSNSDETRVLNAAFELAKQAIPPLGHANAKAELQQLFPTLSFDQITDFYLRAAALADACYDAGDECRGKRMTDEEAITSMRERFPGFSAGTYEQALSWGYFLSR
jgi:hypothetical protein